MNSERFVGVGARVRLGTGLAVDPLGFPAPIAVITIRPNQIAALIVLASLATSAYFFAQGTTSLLAAKLFGLDEVEAPARRASRGSSQLAPQRQRRTAERIIARNIFEPRAEVAEGTVAETAPQVAVAIDLATQNAPPCAAELRMTGAMIHPTMPEWSYVSLAQGQTGPLLYRPGGTFAGRQVIRIDAGPDPESPPLPGGIRRPRTRVVLQDGSGYCQIDMFYTRTGTQAAAPAAGPVTAAVVPPGGPTGPTPPPAAAGPEITPADLDQGITRASDTSYVVQRSLMERALAQDNSLFASARLIPNEQNGAVSGMKVYGIRRSSVLGRLGLQNGDVLQNVNGAPMTSADELMQAYSSLGRSGNFAISVVRRGQPMTIQYQVQ